MSAPWHSVIEDSRPAATIRVLVADHDPIWRRVLRDVLRAYDRINVIADVDSHRPLKDWPVRNLDVAVVGLSHGEVLAGTTRQLSADGVQVILLGLDWSRRGLDAALQAGAVGCLSKTTDLRGVAGSVLSVVGGNQVLSAGLMNFYLPVTANQDASEGRMLDALQRLTDREREVLGMLGEGLSTMEVAKKCRVSSATVKSHVSHALGKLGARNRLEAVLMVRDGLQTAVDLDAAVGVAHGGVR